MLLAIALSIAAQTATPQPPPKRSLGFIMYGEPQKPGNIQVTVYANKAVIFNGMSERTTALRENLATEFSRDLTRVKGERTAAMCDAFGPHIWIPLGGIYLTRVECPVGPADHQLLDVSRRILDAIGVAHK